MEMACNAGSQQQPPTSRLPRLVHKFQPSWYSAVSGTGIIRILLRAAQHEFPGMPIIGTVFYVANIVLLVVFTLLSTLQAVLFPWAMVRMLRSQTQRLYFGAVTMGLSTIISGTVLVALPAYGQWALDLAWALWWLDVFLTALNVFGLPLIMINMQQNSTDSMTGAWLLPIVPAIVVAASGALTATVLPQEHASIIIIVSYALWGIGMGLSFIVMALHFQNLSQQRSSAAEVFVTAFLPLVPCGQGAYAIIELAVAGQNSLQVTGLLNADDIILTVSTVLALIIWGFGLWWIVGGTVSVVFSMRSGVVQPDLHLWSFSHPLGVFVSATIKLGEELPSAFFAYLSLVMLAAVFILYIIVVLVTINLVQAGVFVKTTSQLEPKLKAPVKSNEDHPNSVPASNVFNSCSRPPLQADSTQVLQLCSEQEDKT